MTEPFTRLSINQRSKYSLKLIKLARKAEHCTSREEAQKILRKTKKTQKKILKLNHE